jgi:hypothetical protein
LKYSAAEVKQYAVCAHRLERWVTCVIIIWEVTPTIVLLNWCPTDHYQCVILSHVCFCESQNLWYCILLQTYKPVKGT